MARITVEDCIDKVQNRFELILLASERAKDINAGVHISVERNNDKDPVVALREIAESSIKIDVLKESIVRKLQTTNTLEQKEDEQSYVDIDQSEELGYIPDNSEFYTDESESEDGGDIFNDDISDFNPDS